MKGSNGVFSGFDWLTACVEGSPPQHLSFALVPQEVILYLLSLTVLCICVPGVPGILQTYQTCITQVQLYLPPQHYSLTLLCLCVPGVPGILQTYQACITQVELYGPTNFAPIIRHVTKFGEAAQREPGATVSDTCAGTRVGRAGNQRNGSARV